MAREASKEEIIECRPVKDFLRHIVNHILSDYAEKIPISVFNEIRSRFSKAEEKYKFTIFGGNPYRLAEYLSSEDFDDLITYIKSVNAEEVIRRILEELIKEYSEYCPPVAKKAEVRLKEITEIKEEKEQPKLTPEIIYRTFKMKGYKTLLRDDGTVYVEGSNFNLTIKVSGGTLQYNICRYGKATKIETIEAKIEKIREL